MVPVYIGWPYEIKCDVVFSSLENDDGCYFDEKATTVVSHIILITVSIMSEPKFLETNQ